MSGRCSEDQIEAATAWFARLRSGKLTPTARAELAAWLEADPARRGAWRQVEETWASVEALRADPEVLSLREAARRGSARTRAQRGWLGAALAASLVAATVLVGLAAGSWGGGPARDGVQVARAHTEIGQRSWVMLADQSMVMLDADSAIEVRFSDSKRNLRLVRGRAFFKVAKDPRRPFVVTAGRAQVSALGTEFTVDLTSRTLSVALLEGRVRVAKAAAAVVGAPQSMDMSAGHQLTMTGNDWTLRPVDLDNALAWTHGQLVFDETRLADVVEETNRYSSRRVVVDDSVADRRLSAVLDAGDTETLLNGVSVLKLATVRHSPDGGVRLVRAEP